MKKRMNYVLGGIRSSKSFDRHKMIWQLVTMLVQLNWMNQSALRVCYIQNQTSQSLKLALIIRQ